MDLLSIGFCVVCLSLPLAARFCFFLFWLLFSFFAFFDKKLQHFLLRSGLATNTQKTLSSPNTETDYYYSLIWIFFFSNCFSLESALQVQMVKRLDNWIEMKDGKETKFVIFTQWRTHRRTKIHKIRNKGTHNNNEGNYFGVVSCPTWNKLKKNVVWQRQIYSRDCKPVVLYNRKRRRARVAHCVCSWNFRFHSSHAGRCVRALLRLLNVNFRLN